MGADAHEKCVLHVFAGGGAAVVAEDADDGDEDVTCDATAVLAIG